MKLTDCYVNVRDVTRDPSGNTWGDEVVSRFIDQAVRQMFKWQVDADPSYHNFQMALDDADARNIHSDIWEYDLPPWVHRITRVRETKTTSETQGPYLFPTDIRDGRPGFYLENPKTIRTQGSVTAKDWTLDVVKVPARLHLGTTTAAAPSTTTLLSPVHPTSYTTSTYPHEKDANWYANSVFEITGVATSGHDPVGQTRRCTASARQQESGANYQTLFTFDQAWTEDPDASDTYEMHPEVKDPHLNLLFLLTARHCFTSRRILDGIEAIQDELREERMNFINSVQPVQDMEPAFWRTGNELHQGLDPDRDYLLGNTYYRIG